MVNLRQTEEIENKIAELLLAKFDISDSLLKEVTKKISFLANKRVEESIKKNKDPLPDKKLTGVVKEILKPVSSKNENPKTIISSKEIITRLDSIQKHLLSSTKDFNNSSKFSIPKDIFKNLKLPSIPEFSIPKDIFKNLKLPSIPEFRLPDNIFKGLRLPSMPEFSIPKDIFKGLKLPKPQKEVLKESKQLKTSSVEEEKKYSIKDRFKESGLFGLTKDLFKKVSSSTEKENSNNSSLLGSIKNILPKSEPKQLTLDETSSSKVLLDGITENGFNSLVDKLPKLLKGIFGKKIDPKKDKKEFGESGLLSFLPPGLMKLLGPALAVGGGIALLLGGLAALITGLQTDGPFKGLLKIFSKVGIMGGLKLLEVGALGFLKNIKTLISIPTKIFKIAASALKGVFGKEAIKGMAGGLKLTKGLLPKLLGGLVKFITPLLKRLPLVGTVIGFAFAWSRFKSGDTVGGVIDILSGLAGLLDFAVPGLGTGLSIGLDVLNAFLDVKAGGASPEASKKKAGMIGGFFKGIASWIYEKSKNLPVIGRLIKAGEAFSTKNWAKGLVQLSRVIPGTGWVMDLFGYTEEKQEQVIGGQLKVMGDLTTLIKEKIWDKVFGFASRTWDAVKEWWQNTKNWWKETKEEISNSYLGKQFSGLMSWMKTSIWDKITGFASRTWDGIKNWWSKITDWWSNDNMTVEPEANQNSFNVISDLMSWIRDSIWGKVTGFLGDIIDSVKEGVSSYIENLSWDPLSWAGLSQQKSKPEEEIGLAEGGIVPATPGGRKVTVAEGGQDEAIIPLDQYMSPEGSKISNDILQVIASNTGNTNDTIRNLSEAILKLADIFGQKNTASAPNNFIINSQNQPQQYPSAAQVAASNIDPIRSVRSQFAV